MAAVTVLRLSRCCRSLNGATSDASHHQKLAVEHDAGRQACDHIGKGCRNIVAGAREEAPLAALMCRLHADAVPLPFRHEVLRLDQGQLPVLDLMRQHQRAEGRHRSDIRPRPYAGKPGEQLGIRRAKPVPDLFDLGERHFRPFGERGLGEPRRDADAERSGEELEQRPALGGIEPVQPIGQEARHLASAWRASALARCRQAAASPPTPRLLARSARWSRRCRRHSRARGRTAPDRCGFRSSRRGCGGAAAGRTARR